MTPTFEEWLAKDTRLPREQWTFKQYGNYADGWRNSMPWAHKGMSVAYDRWAEEKWAYFPDKDWLQVAWKMGLQSNHERLERGESALSAEDAADVVLSIPAIIMMATETFFNQSKGGSE